MALAAGLVAWAVTNARASTPLLVYLGVCSGLLVVVSMLAARPGMTGAGVGGLVTLWAISVLIRPTVGVVGAAVGLYIVSELAFQAVDLTPTGSTDEGAEAQRWLLLGTVVGVSVVVGGLSIVAARRMAGGDLVMEALGLVAVAGIAGLVLVLVRRVPRTEP